MISWNSLKISIAGAKLSHLVQQDKIWDHGSMVEQVRMVVVLLKKAFHKGDAEIIKKCLTHRAYKMIEDPTTHVVNMNTAAINHDPERISIINVSPGKNGRQDRFTASLKFYNNPDNEQWLFVRHGDWWLLDEIILKKHFNISNLFSN